MPRKPRARVARVGFQEQLFPDPDAEIVVRVDDNTGEYVARHVPCNGKLAAASSRASARKQAEGELSRHRCVRPGELPDGY